MNLFQARSTKLRAAQNQKNQHCRLELLLRYTSMAAYAGRRPLSPRALTIPVACRTLVTADPETLSAPDRR
jgi:hypothetical protein